MLLLLCYLHKILFLLEFCYWPNFRLLFLSLKTFHLNIQILDLETSYRHLNLSNQFFKNKKSYGTLLIQNFSYFPSIKSLP